MRAIKIFSVLSIFSVSSIFAQKIAGPLILEPDAAQGLTLISPLNSNTTYLIDNCGRVINTWQSEFLPGYTAYLLPNGNLVRTMKLPNTFNPGAGSGGGVELYDWESNLLWSIEFNNDTLRYHHDVAVLPNGNILMIVWRTKTAAQALAAGRDPALIPQQNNIWAETIFEVKPVLPNSHEIVWQWSVWDHLIQDYDPTKAHYGNVSQHPERIDVNYTKQVIPDWMHMNSIDYNEELDQIVLSPRDFDELWIIDHSTTTAEASTSSGGNENKGGDLLYRWGNPRTYKQGTELDQRLFAQHDVHWIKEGDMAGNLILFNNLKDESYSSVEIIEPPINTTFTYDLTGSVFGPADPTFVFTDQPNENLFSGIMAGAELLPNGNLLICSSRQGFIYEVTPSNEKVWYYKNPFTNDGIVGRDFFTMDPNYKNDLLFRAQKYRLDFGAFENRDLTPKEPIEGEPWAPCDLVTAVDGQFFYDVRVYPNPVAEMLMVSIANASGIIITASLVNMHGQILQSKEGKEKLVFDLSEISSGLYFLRLNNTTYKIIRLDR